MGYQIYLGYLSTAAALLSYVPYLRNIFRGHTKPHAFSWLVWSLLTAIAFGVQVQSGAGAGAWVTGITAAACFSIFLLALLQGEKNIIRFDVISLVGALIAFVLWFVSSKPLMSIILIILIYLFGYLPTFRKTYHKPYEETVLTYALSATKYLLGLIALNDFTLLTFLFPLSVLLMDVSFVCMALFRRKEIYNRTPIK